MDDSISFHDPFFKAPGKDEVKEVQLLKVRSETKMDIAKFKGPKPENKVSKLTLRDYLSFNQLSSKAKSPEASTPGSQNTNFSMDSSRSPLGTSISGRRKKPEPSNGEIMTKIKK